MAPSPQETVAGDRGPGKVSKPLTGEEVVITGISGVFPSSDSVLQFMDNLYNKVDMVSSDNTRWVFNHPEVPAHLGKVSNMGKFDAQFFRVHYKQACTMEPMSRKMLEHAYAAIYDSGINPLQLRGKKVGVFIGSSFSESEKTIIYETIQRNGFGISGCNKSMYANRISYWIDGKGPSYALDIACSSSMACLEHAYKSISEGLCEAAIVGGCNLCMIPNVSLNIKRAGFLCLDGKTKCFDKNGDGYVRSDAINVLFLQRAKDAKRIYTEVYYAKSNFGMGHIVDAKFLPVRVPQETQKFFEEFYSEIDVNPEDVDYIEANGAAIAEADRNELEAIGNVFAKNTTVKIGSVKSNMGHSEPASGVCALTKICLAYHKGELPANLHYYEPHDDIEAVREGRIQVLQENEPFNRGFVAANSFSYSGGNVHVLLKGHQKLKDPERYKCNIPYLVLVSGRQEPCVMKIMTLLKNHPIDPEEIGLLHNIHAHEIPGHMCRGYTIIETNEEKETVSLAENMEYCPGNVRPLWFVYSGMGSQWAGMGAELMRIPTFAAAIERCHKVLEPKGIDIVKILTDPDKTIYDNILNSFVGIAAVQIGLTDILREMGIVPDNIIGHSVGELGCAYADGCFTAEEMILSAYSRGLVSVQTPFIRGSMAAVGLGYKAVLPMCPPEIEVACHNSSESSTISGPADIMKEFVSELTGRGIFAKEVPCSNIAYHSKYIADAGPGLLKYLSEVIQDPKPRSEKWVSTSVPEEKWGEPIAKLSSAEYHTNNLLNPVLFEETSKAIPSNAIVIEIAPHGLLQAILKRSIADCTHIPLTRRAHSDPVKFLLEGIGKLYENGLNPKVDILYPKIEFPVSSGTPLLSHFVDWEHSENWPQAKFNRKYKVFTPIRQFVMSIHDDDFKYFVGHVREDAYMFPEAALLVLIWETLGMHKSVDFRDLSVSFKDVLFSGEATVRNEVPLRLLIMIHKGNNKFEVSYEGSDIVSGYITELEETKGEPRTFELPETDGDDVVLSKEDVYKIMKFKGYGYSGDFKSIESLNVNRKQANVKWTEKWVPFLDGLIQLNTFLRDYNGLTTPKIIKNLTIDVAEHKKITEEMENSNVYNAQVYNLYKITKCGGITIDNMILTDKPKMEQEPDVLETRAFVPHFLTGDVDPTTALLINLQIISDNVADSKVKVTEFHTPTTSLTLPSIKEVSDNISTTEFDVKTVQLGNADYESAITKDPVIGNSNVFIVSNVLGDEKKMKNIHKVIPNYAFLLTLETDSTIVHPKYKLFNLISAMAVQKHILVLLKKAHSQEENVTYIPVKHDNKFSWVPRVLAELEKTRRVVLVSEKQPYCGVLGLVKKLKKNYPNKIGLISVDDYQAPSFNAERDIFKDQLLKNLVFNVYKKGQWGGYYYLPNVKSVHLNNVTLTCAVPGDVDSLTWVEAPETRASNRVVQVCYAGPSYRDALKTTGKVEDIDKAFGMDFSGIDNKGEKVMGLISGGALTTTVEADPNLVWPVPEHWSLEDAATVPLAYAHAYYCLAIKSSLRRENTVFVNGGAGALGQAVIAICLDNDCTVFTTVSDVNKKKFLLQLFPDLKEQHIGNSRDSMFFDTVIQNTANRRCDIVINCLSGDLRESAMKCCGLAGIVLNVSEYDMMENQKFGMSYLYEERNYISVQLSNIFKSDNVWERKYLQSLIAEGIANGLVRPLTRVVYSPLDVQRAFRLLSSSRHRGRVLIAMRDPATVNEGLKVTPRMTYSSRGAYVVVCDEYGLAIELINRMVMRGARKLIINLKPNTLVDYFHTKNASWRKLGVSVILSTDNLQTEKGCVNLLKEGAKLGPIQGIFIVQDTQRVNAVVEAKDFVEKFNKTALITANLDLTSRNVCADLSNFVVITRSSTSLSDEYVSSVIDKICQGRNETGLPALVYRIGSFDKFDPNSENFQSKVQPQTLPTVLNALETSLKLKYNNVISFNLKKQTDAEFQQKIAKILGVKDLTEIPDDLTVENLRINEVNIDEIIAVIKEIYEVDFPYKTVKQMSIASLKSLGKELIQNNTRFHSGLYAFFTFIEEDECLATEPMIVLPTKVNQLTETEECDPKETYVMLIPGYQGHSDIFTSICERLKTHAVVWQLGPDLENDIQQMALGIISFMKKRFELKSKFYLMGYSFGVNVALELAALLEKEGYVGIVYCLDSSPESLSVQLDAYLGHPTDEQLQDSIVEHMYRLMTGEDSEELKKDLRKAENWNAKTDACVSRLKSLAKYSNQYKRGILDSAYKRIKLARTYDPKMKLQSELVLLKAIPHPNAKKLPEDYNLSKYTTQPVRVYDLQHDHVLATEDCRVSNIMNRLFEPHVLEEFKKKNLCDSYMADPMKLL